MSDRSLPKSRRAPTHHQRDRVKKIATLNIGTLTGRHREIAALLKRRRRIDIACLQDTKCLCPTDCLPEEKKEDLDALISRTPEEEHVLLGADLNSHVDITKGEAGACHRGHGYIVNAIKKAKE
ncbi:hypothetical protein M513_10591 [Trichuris suis]|uniref:Endonuclease/exonuclease/phosphatase domain-containing protein n=1 Tax=Trichuris suis TaxID=68888 RepID=A0A085LU68_9BILA|nr:hypothetical protein M513_10591 [Trichuris suis]